MNQTNICTDEIILNLCNSMSITHDNTISNVTPFLPIFGVLGTISVFLYHNRPQIIEKKEIANYINYETNTRYHEYSFMISWGHEKISWDYLPFFREIKSMEVHKNTETEFYYLTRNTGEEFIQKDCLKIKESEKIKKVYFTNIKQFKNDNIETIYLTTKDKEESSYRIKMSEKRYPDYNMPEKILIINENRVDIHNYEIIFSEEQSKNMMLRNSNYTKYILWKNSSIDDCFIEKGKLKIIVNEIPKNHGGIAGTTMIDLL